MKFRQLTNSKNVIVFGGAGFIGSQLGYYYAKIGNEVHLVDDFSYGHEDNLDIEGEKFGVVHELDVRNEKIEDADKYREGGREHEDDTR